MRLCVFGAGAIGGFIAAHLARVDGIEVSVIARGAHLAAIQSKGITVRSPSGSFTSHVRATERAAEIGKQDVVFIALKQHQVTPALDDLRLMLGPDSMVMPPTTGIPYWYFHGLKGPFENRQIERLDPGGRQWQVLGPERAVGCVYWVATKVVEPGVINHDGKFANFPIGEPDGSMSSRVKAIGKAMEAGGLKAPIVENIRSWLWMKMISSLSWNPVAVLTLATNGEIAKRPEVVDIVRRMMVEGGALAAKFGVCDMPMSVEERLGLGLSITGHKMSMLQDLERGRSLEVNVLLDSVRAMRDLSDVDMPTIELVCSLLELRASILSSASA